MNHYDVTIRETLEVKMKVAANSREEAEQFARNQWKRGEVVLDASHFTGVEFHGLLGGTPPNTLFERMEVFMEGLFFAIGFLLGGVVGVLIMCLLQINRISKKEDSEE